MLDQVVVFVDLLSDVVVLLSDLRKFLEEIQFLLGLVLLLFALSHCIQGRV